MRETPDFELKGAPRVSTPETALSSGTLATITASAPAMYAYDASLDVAQRQRRNLG